MNNVFIASCVILAACGGSGSPQADAGVAFLFAADIHPTTGYSIVLDNDPTLTHVEGHYDSYEMGKLAFKVPVSIMGANGVANSVLAPGYCDELATSEGKDLGAVREERVTLEAFPTLTLGIFSAECDGTADSIAITP